MQYLKDIKGFGDIAFKGDDNSFLFKTAKIGLSINENLFVTVNEGLYGWDLDFTLSETSRLWGTKDHFHLTDNEVLPAIHKELKKIKDGAYE